MSEPREVIRIEGVTKRFGAVTALHDVTLGIREGEFFALLGPSGCGKTTLLRLLAGFERPDRGRLLLDGRDLVGVKPYRRPLNMMFQSYALFPHMTVEENVAYGLRMEGLRRREALARAHDALALVHLEGLGGRRPAQLSGGQRQRVALARALVKRPRVLLLDEPLSALDRQIRSEMQVELKRIQHTVGVTFIVVTHDQEEAITMADRIAVLDRGRIVQVGEPETLYEVPETLFVARFLGESNLFSGTLELGEDRAFLVDSDVRWEVDAAQARRRGLAPGTRATAVVRPERTIVAAATRPPTPAPPNLASGVVAETVYLGAARKVVVDLARGGTVQARFESRGDGAFAPGEAVVVGWEPAAAALVVASDEPTGE
ncbi:MAG: ABC transporter ATP-binding protein [Thermoleophilia bacterium]|nr:ABC transporter ATP-binding protein [Gaiellaceae bacterium]MDW8337645.1 ABC transporter ATP-binding protein [Thermoleophilia bacterium]